MRYTSKPELVKCPAREKNSSVSHDTVYAIVENAFMKYSERRCMGTRTFLGMHTPEGARFPLAKFGESTWHTFGQAGDRVKHFGFGLRKLGINSSARDPTIADKSVTNAGATGLSTILLFEETCAPWTTALLGAFSQNIAVATSYATLGMKSVALAVRETSARAIVCNIKHVELVSQACQDNPALHIIYTTNNSEKLKWEGNVSHQVHSMEDIISLGLKSEGELKLNLPQPESVAVIMYTSGSTGTPKGVVLTHANLTASIGALQLKFREFGLKPGGESYLSYLPAAHILELVAQITCLSLGAEVGFADPRTLSAKGAVREVDGKIMHPEDAKYPAGALQEFAPSLFAAVPKIWDVLMKGVVEKLGHGSGVMKFLFQVAFIGRHWAVCQGRESYLFKAVVFSKLRGAMGGNMKVGVTGGGPISADVQNFIRTAFAMPLIQGYALTETCCGGTIQMLQDVRNGVVGPPLPSIELKLETCTEIKDRSQQPYRSDDKQHYSQPCLGRGEVWIRGPSVAKGYFKLEDKTKAEFVGEGAARWFKSGDIGVFLPDGSLMLVDRVKNLVKLKGGEYVAIEAMEKEYGTSVLVNPMNGGIMCFGDGDMDRPVAIVQVNMIKLEEWAQGAKVSYSSPEDLCMKPEAEKFVLDDLVKIGKGCVAEGSLGGNELLIAVGLIPGTGPNAGDLKVTSPWTPENQGLTASNKLNRQPILKACDSMLKQLKVKASR